MLTSEEPVSLVTLLAALSYALDLTEGQPMGHALRTCLIGLRIAREIGVGGEERDDLHLALLLKDAGCSSNAARMYTLFGGDEILAKRDSKIRDWRRMSEAVKFALRHAAPHEGLARRLEQLRFLSRQPGRVMDALTETRCTRGAEIATLLGLGERVAGAIHALDEHWDGQGAPYRRAGQAIPLLARIACLAQTLEVFVTTYGIVQGYTMLRQRSGTWFDPELVRAAQAFESESAFWEDVRQSPERRLWEKTSERLRTEVTEASLDSVCEAFARIVDAKSSFTGEHSARVADYALELAHQLGVSAQRQVTLRRAALLHDLGKLAVPNLILDKPDRLTADEFALVRRHPYYTEMILTQIPALGRIAQIAAAHHEKLDGSGYHRGVTAEHLDQEMRILAVADIFDALTATRPYRAALPPERVQAILAHEAGGALDPDCVAAASALLERPEAPALRRAA